MSSNGGFSIAMLVYRTVTKSGSVYHALSVWGLEDSSITKSLRYISKLEMLNLIFGYFGGGFPLSLKIQLTYGEDSFILGT